MGNLKHNEKGLVPKFVAGKAKERKYINKDPEIMGGWQIEGNHAKAFLSIRLVQHSYQCFAEWDSQDMQSFWRFVTTLHNLTWQQIFATATKDPKYKTGVGYTVIEARNYPNEDFKDTLDPETTFFELRVDQQRRVHGFRDKSIFYLCWLDRNHALT